MTSRVSQHAVCASLDRGAVVLHMVTKRYFTLNESGAFIWALLEQGMNTSDIVSRVCATFAISADQARAALERLLAELRTEQLLAENA